MSDEKSEIPEQADELDGLDEQALMASALETEVATGRDQVGWEPPKPEELASTFPNHDILELLGRGGMGAVYKARQRELDRLVAIKIMAPGLGKDPAFAERFAREARALAQLSHPNIVTIYDSGHVDDLFYFVMELVDGVNLRQAIRTGSLSPQQALEIVPQICDALQYTHGQGIVHRDIKPENILLDQQGGVKIADFGLAKLLGDKVSDLTLTGTEQLMGTIRYMAPEQMEGSANVDHRADIFSLGVVFYEMLTGELPLGRFASPSEKVQIDVRLDEVVLHALEKEPARRYQQAEEVKSDMQTIASEPRGDAHSPARSEGKASLAGAETTTAAAPKGSRLSRKAIIGAIWAATVLIAAIPVMIAADYNSTRAFSHSGPFGLMMIPVLLISLPGLTAPIGTTILGTLALGDIRRSRGSLTGLPLALGEALFFPLVVLDLLIWGFWFLLGLLANRISGDSNWRYDTDLPLLVSVLLTMVSAAVIDFFIVRAAWRAAKKPALQ